MYGIPEEPISLLPLPRSAFHELRTVMTVLLAKNHTNQTMSSRPQTKQRFTVAYELSRLKETIHFDCAAYLRF